MRTKLFNSLLVGGLLLLSTFACNKNEDGSNPTDWLTEVHDSTPNIILRGGGGTTALTMTVPLF